MTQMKMQVNAVLFDLDGTILDSIHIYYQIIETVFQRLEFPLPSRDKLRKAAGKGDFDWGEVFPETTPQEMDRRIRKTREIIAEIYPGLFRAQATLIPNAKTTLEAIMQKGIKMGIVTSTPRESMVVKLPVLVDSGIDDLLDVIIHADDAPRKKPAPDPLIEGCKRLDIRPQDCMYVGDTRTDIQAGKAAGMKTVGVLTGFDDRQSLGREHPDTILLNISELPEIISTLKAPEVGSSPLPKIRNR